MLFIFSLWTGIHEDIFKFMGYYSLFFKWRVLFGKLVKDVLEKIYRIIFRERK